MMRLRRLSVGPRTAHRLALIVVLAGGFLACTAAQPIAAPQDTRPIVPPASLPSPAPPPPIVAPPVIPPRSATGMCQCLADKERRNIRCLSSPQECQAACAANKYSFVPNAPSCPATAQERGR